jgi:dihydroorotase-like cyclic amidohydrolase
MSVRGRPQNANLDRVVTVDLPTLNSVVDFSPYVGWTARGWADTTIAGGEVVYEKGEVVADRPRGRYLRRM